MNLTRPFSFVCLASAAIIALAVSGCKTETPVNPPTASLFDSSAQNVMRDLTKNVILPTVSDFDARGDSLVAAVNVLSTAKNEASLAAARDAWKRVRVPYESSEAFLFGPAVKQRLDPSVDLWPLDQLTLVDLLGSNIQFTEVFFDTLDGTLKGAHAIEYILWGTDGLKKAADITTREMQYLVACTASFHGAADSLRRAWTAASDGGGDYSAQFYNAGTSLSTTYSSQQQAMADLLNAMASIVHEVEATKMGLPYSTNSTETDESRYSDNSRQDFLASISGVQNLYLGTYSIYSGKGLTDLIKAKNAALDKQIQDKITDCLTRISNISPSFDVALVQNKSLIATARAGLQELQALFDVNARTSLGLTK